MFIQIEKRAFNLNALYSLTSKVKDKFSVILMEELSLAKLYVTTIV